MCKKILFFSFAVFVTLLLSCDIEGKSSRNSSQGTNTPSENPADDPSDNYPAVIKLESLEISAGILTPEFNPDTTVYYVVITPDISELAITARPDVGCSIKINDLPVTSGQDYSTVLQIVNPETDINILVSAENGESLQYTLNVIKPLEKTVENYSFELFNDQNCPSGWEVSGAGEFISSSESARSGSCSGTFTTLTGTISGREIISAPVEIEQDRNINLSGWFYIPVIEGVSSERTRLGFKIYYFTDADCLSPASTAYDTMAKKFLKEQGVWEKINYELAKESVPADTQYVRIGIRACFDSTKGGTKNDKIFIDDISLQQ